VSSGPLSTLAVIAYPVIDPVALRLGPFSVRWYGLAYLLGFVCAGLVLRQIARRWKLGLTDDDVVTIMLGAVLGVVIGARLGYVALYGGAYYWSHPALVFALWDGGMSFHGGLVGIIVAAAVVGKLLGMPWLTLCDLGAIGAPIGIFLGRLANFVNGELWGRVTTVPWAMVFPNAGPLPRHPSQLYEAVLEGLVLLGVMVWLATRERVPYRGTVLGWMLVVYAVFRIGVEFLRQPDVQIGFLPGGVTMGQLLSVPLLVCGIALLVWSHRAKLPQSGPVRSGAAGSR
jgi:phosphatidylglycerol---prolipoprotein diacylglyceryl transferase